MANWKGTAVPTSGYVEKIYINTSISNYYNILKNVTFTDASALGQSGFSFYPVMAFLGSSSIPYVLAFKKFSDADIDFALINFSNMSTTQDFFIGDNGWQSFVNPYNIGYEVLPTLSGLPIGNQNELLTEMISITPFEEIVDPILNLPEFLTGIADAIRSKKGTTAPINAQNFATEIESIESGGSGEDRLKAFFDFKKSCNYEFFNLPITYEQLITIINYNDTSQVTNMGNMFSGCKELTSIPQLDTSKVTDISYMFNECNRLTSIPQLDTSQVTNMSRTFYNCKNLTTIPQLDTSQVTNMSNTFYGCGNIESILMTGMKVDFTISASTKFTREALVTILNNLATVTSTKKLTMGSTNLAKLTEEDKAIATNKGWTLA